MISFSRVLLLLSLPLFLSSCFSMDSIITIGTDGKLRSVTTVDMTKMAAMMQSFASGSTDSWSTSMDSNLCSDDNFKPWETDSGKTQITKCTELGDYRARIESEGLILHNPGILVLSGVIVVDAMHIMSDTQSSPMSSSSANASQSSSMSSDDLWISVTESIVFPWPIVHKDGWKLVGSNTLSLDLADSKIAKKKELYIIATTQGKKLKPSEVAKYKRLLRIQSIRMKKLQK